MEELKYCSRKCHKRHCARHSDYAKLGELKRDFNPDGKFCCPGYIAKATFKSYENNRKRVVRKHGGGKRAY